MRSDGPPVRGPLDAGLIDTIRVVARFPADESVAPRWLAVDKPSGVLSVPGRLPEHKGCVASWVQATFAHATGPITVHRLDLDTSGLLVVALDAPMQSELSKAFERREVSKAYVAIVDGIVRSDEGQVDVPMRLDVDRRPMQVIDYVQGKSALTQYRVLKRGVFVDTRSGATKPATLLRLTPVTGRTHQLRVHCAAMGHAILGDMLYAHDAARDASARLLLHACELGLTDPLTGASVAISVPAPFELGPG